MGVYGLVWTQLGHWYRYVTKLDQLGQLGQGSQLFGHLDKAKPFRAMIYR